MKNIIDTLKRLTAMEWLVIFLALISIVFHITAIVWVVSVFL